MEVEDKNNVNNDTVADRKEIHVEVAYALPQDQKIIPLTVLTGTSAYEAVIRSGITDHFPHIDLDVVAMGIFGEAMDGKKLPVPKEYQLKHQDRVEIYRPLLIDPKQARANRAAKAKTKKAALAKSQQ